LASPADKEQRVLFEMMVKIRTTGSVIRTFPSPGGGDAAFSPDGSKVLIDDYNTVNLWDAATGTLIRTWVGEQCILFLSI
jgi:hypothetical protein